MKPIFVGITMGSMKNLFSEISAYRRRRGDRTRTKSYAMEDAIEPKEENGLGIFSQSGMARQTSTQEPTIAHQLNEENFTDNNRSVLSTRCMRDLQPYYLKEFMKNLDNRWYAINFSSNIENLFRSEENPDGAIILSVAENVLSIDLMQVSRGWTSPFLLFLKAKLKSITDFDASCFVYGDLSGELPMKKAAVTYMQSTWLSVKQ